MQLNPPRRLLKSCHWTAQAQLFDCKLTVSQDCGSSNGAQWIVGWGGGSSRRHIFNGPSCSKLPCIPQLLIPLVAVLDKSHHQPPAPTKLSYHQHSIAEVRYAHEGELPSNFPTGPWKDANKNYIEHLIEDPLPMEWDT
jgi:hypothetical protein